MPQVHLNLDDTMLTQTDFACEGEYAKMVPEYVGLRFTVVLGF